MHLGSRALAITVLAACCALAGCGGGDDSRAGDPLFGGGLPQQQPRALVGEFGGEGRLLASAADQLLVARASAAAPGGQFVEWWRGAGADLQVVPLDTSGMALLGSAWSAGPAGVVGSAQGQPGGAYHWDLNGTRTTLAEAAGAPLAPMPAMGGNWIAWTDGTPTLRLLNWPGRRAADAPALADPDAPGSLLAFAGPPAVVDLGGSAIVFATAVSRSGSALYAYDSRSTSFTRLSPEDQHDGEPRSDGSRVAWLRGGAGGPAMRTLVVAAASAPLQQAVLSGTATDFQVGDGLVAWRETAASAPAPSSTYTIKVHDGSQTHTVVADQPGAELKAVGAGRVAYTVGNATFVWHADPGSRQALPEAAAEVQLLPGALVHTNAARTAVYRVPLP